MIKAAAAFLQCGLNIFKMSMCNVVVFTKKVQEHNNDFAFRKLSEKAVVQL